MKPEYINPTLMPPEKFQVQVDDKSEETIKWVAGLFTPSQVFDEEVLHTWAHENSFLSIEEYLEWTRFNQHMTLEDYCKSLNK